MCPVLCILPFERLDITWAMARPSMNPHKNSYRISKQPLTESWAWYSDILLKKP